MSSSQDFGVFVYNNSMAETKRSYAQSTLEQALSLSCNSMQHVRTL